MTSAQLPVVDERVRKLCEAMNQIPGITTIGSCGGHESPGPGQVSEDEFYVSFFADRDVLGWYGLDVICNAAEDFEDLEVNLSNDGGTRTSIFGMCDPDEVAICLLQKLESEYRNDGASDEVIAAELARQQRRFFLQSVEG